MFKFTVAVIVATTVVVAAPCLAGGLGQQCSPAGTWYGGNDLVPNVNYLLTIIRNGPRTFTATFQGAFSLEGLYGFPSVSTQWSGELVRTADSVYKFRILSLENWDAANFPPSQPSLINGVEGEMEFSDCDVAASTITFFGVYPWGATPFVDTPIIEPPTPIYETYYRIPRAE